VRQSILQGLISYRNQIHTITYDNGLEFSEHQNIPQTLSANIYFAHPYSYRERGLNENTNRLIRQYLPKPQPLNNVTHKELNYIIDQLNIDPEKLLVSKPHMSYSSKNILY
jgi:transposase, IS30 family